MSKGNYNITEKISTTKIKIGEKEGLALIRKFKTLHVTKGKKVLEVNLKEAVSDDDLKELVIGRSGNLRAPVMVQGDIVFVGFNEDALEELFDT